MTAIRNSDMKRDGTDSMLPTCSRPAPFREAFSRRSYQWKKKGESGASERLQSLRGRERQEEFSYPPGAANLAWRNREAVASGVGIWSSDWDRF